MSEEYVFTLRFHAEDFDQASDLEDQLVKTVAYSSNKSDTNFQHALHRSVTTLSHWESGIFEVWLDYTGDKKIQVIKEIRALCLGMGLKEAKDLADAGAVGRTLIISNIGEDAAKHCLKMLESAGARAHIERNHATPEEIKDAIDGSLDVLNELQDRKT